MERIDWPEIWGRVAARVAAHATAGRGHLLTEDAVRFETVHALEEFGVEPDRLAFEVLAPALAGGKLDLVVDGLTGAVVELKFPRGSRVANSPVTNTLGDLLRDFLRVAVVPAADRWVVQLLNDRLVRYVESTAPRHGLRWTGQPGQRLELPAAAIAALPVTATRAIGAAAVPGAVTAACVLAAPAGVGVTLFAYRVDALVAAAKWSPESSPVTPASAAAVKAPPPPAVASGSRDGAREEILAAARAIVTRAGRPEFTMPEVIAEMRRRGTGYAEATIRTMISAHLCAEVTGHGIAGYADLTRVDRGLYRLARPELS